MKISILLEALTGSFETDMKRASKETERAAKKMQKDFEESGKAIGQALAGAAIAVAALVKSSINSADELSKLSQKVGISVESLSALKLQAGLSGVEIESLQTSLKKFNKTIVEAAGGSKVQAESFKLMGITLKDSNGNLKSTETLLGDVADKFAGYKDGAAKTALAMNLFGRAGADMIVQLNGGREAMEVARIEAEALGQVIGSETAKQAEQFNDNLSRAGMLATGFGNALAAKLLPSLVSVTDEFIRGQKESKTFESAADGVAEVLKVLAKAAIITKGVIEGLVNILAASVDTLAAFNDISNSVAESIGHAAAGALKNMTGDYAGAVQEFSKARDTFNSGWEEGAKKIDIAWQAAQSGADEAIEGALKLADAIDAPFKQAEQRGKDFQDVIGGIGKYAAQTEAPIVSMAGAAANGADKAAAKFQKLQDSIVSGQEKLDDLASSFVENADPVDQVLAKFRDQIIDIGRAAEDQQSKIDAFMSGGGDPEEAAQKQAAAQETVARGIQAAIDARDRNIASINAERDITGAYLADLAKEAKLIGLSSTQQRIESTVMRALADAKRLNAQAGKELVKVDEARIRQQATLNEALSIAATINQPSPFEQLIEQAETLGEAITQGIKDGLDPSALKPMQDALSKMNSQVRRETIGAFMDLGQAIVGSLKNSAQEGSRHYAALEVAQSALALGQGINAILTQGQGDPYTAFGRMAAMAAVVIPLAAQLGASIKSFGASGFSDTAAQRQASQGTGTVLGDADAKSESIANAIEITAGATSQLVGISRGMLQALQALQAGLGSAAVMLARGAGTADFSGMNLAVGNNSMMSNSINDPFGFFKGKSKITDEGIIIFGGALNDMLDSIAVGAYQEVQSRSWAFGSTHTNEGVTDVSDEFSKQFSLIMNSIADTVREGATALGILPAEIEAAMAAYQVAEMHISLKDLTAEEQQAELQAVFSSIFDGLAGSVVPFIAQFQKVGEGLGETLVRVATGVQVTQEAMKQLGLVINETDPERFAQISEGLIDAVGGLDAFISGMQNFVSAFADDQHKLQVATEALNSAFEQAGLSVPATAEGMFALMQTLDATTEAGREQIATLLRLGTTAREYYDLLEKAEKARRDYAEKALSLQDELNPSGGFIAGRNEVDKWLEETTQSLNDLARAAGRAGASEQDLVNAHAVAAQRIAQLIKKLKDQATDLAVQLGYTSAADTLDSLNAQIDSFSSATVDASDAVGSAVDAMREKMNLLLGDLSPFNDQKKLELALQGLRDGTVDASQVLEIGRRLYASTSNYTDLFNQVMGMANNGGSNPADTASTQSEAQGRTLQELIAARDALLAAQRPELADELARRIAELAYATGDDFTTLAESMGFGLDQIADDLGLNADQLNAYLQQLEDQFNAQDFADVGQMIQDAISNSADRIVEAITGEPSDAIAAADQRAADMESKRAESEAANTQATMDKLDEVIAAVRSTSTNSTAQIVDQLSNVRRDFREQANGMIANNPRYGSVPERIR